MEGTWITNLQVFDSFGRAHKLEVEFSRDPLIANRWRAAVNVDPDAETATNTDVAGGAAAEPNVFFVDFDNNGVLQSVFDSDLNLLGDTGDLIAPIAFDVPEADAVAGAAYRQTVNLNLGTVGTTQDGLTQFGVASSAKMVRQDGYTMGYMESYKIDQSGIITGVYSNGANRVLAQIALGSFTNPGGLEKAGESTYVVSNNSGEANIGESGIAGKGKLIAGALEMSNVDLAEQFTDMIVTQRGFQASARSITTSDELLNEVVNLKR